MHGATRSFHAWGNPERGEKSNDAKPRNHNKVYFSITTTFLSALFTSLSFYTHSERKLQGQ